MASLLLVIIYVAFISLGLPDSLLGAGWPSMYGELGVPSSYVGIISMIISCGTIVSSLMSERMTKRAGAGLVTAVSVLLTAAALFGFSISNKFILLCLWAVPYGIGAGGVDAALNNYVALHYSSRHMSWLHCFWGVGTSISPCIMSMCLTKELGWSSGYRVVSIMQLALTAAIFFSLPLWKKQDNGQTGDSAEVGIVRALKIRGVVYVLLTFFGYCALEGTAGLWASSYLVQNRGIDAEIAARFASLYYLGITFGRFFGGFIADRVGDKALVRVGIGIILAGIGCILLPYNNAALCGLVIIGLGSAPIYPSIIHATPSNFGKENSQAIVGIQMASAYLGTTFMPPLFGVLSGAASIGLYPWYLAVFAILMLVMSERLNRIVKSN